jgi:SWI/SNF-related matrix-associated actin-dependent regulator 1 of chromatin subfamily A
MLILSDEDDEDSTPIQHQPKKRRMLNRMLADDSDEDDSTSTAATSISNATNSESDPDGKPGEIDSVTEDNEQDQRQSMEHDNGDDGEDDDAFMDKKANTNNRLNASSTSHKVALLREEFPALARDEALLALNVSDGDFTKAMQRLKVSHSQPSPLAASPTRKRLVRRIDSSESEGDDDDDSEDEEARALEIEQLKQAVQTVTFYNTCRPQEMMDVTGCSMGAVEKMMGLRPFENLQDLKDKLKQERGLSLKYVTDYMEVLEGYSAVDQIIQSIEDIGGQLQAILDVWQQSGSSGGDDDEDAGTHLVDVDINNGQMDTSSAIYKDAMDGFLTQQPDSVNPDFTLKPYQITGVNWMLLLYRKGISGILADEMGLGKTAQVISFLGRLQELGESGPHLIVVPSSTLDNWMREFERFCPVLEVRCYYGTQNERREQQQDIMYDRDTIHAVVTTYAIAAGRVEDRTFLRRLRCKSMILDEGHMIKNYTSARYGHLMRLDTPFRLLLTGTPLQNNLQELVSLLIFIMPKVFSGSEDDVRKIFKLKAGGSESSNKASSTTATTATNTAQMLSRQRIERAKKMMSPFVLRRRKAQVLIHLPKKIHHVDYCPMTPKQQTMYAQIVADSQDRYNDVAEDNTNKKMEKFNNIVMQLRKAADHPLLFRHIYNNDKIKVMAKEIRKEERYWDSDEQYILEDMEIMTDFELNRLCRDHKVSREKEREKDKRERSTLTLFLSLVYTTPYAGERRMDGFGQSPTHAPPPPSNETKRQQGPDL